MRDTEAPPRENAGAACQNRSKQTPTGEPPPRVPLATTKTAASGGARTRTTTTGTEKVRWEGSGGKGKETGNEADNGARRGDAGESASSSVSAGDNGGGTTAPKSDAIDIWNVASPNTGVA